MDKKFYIVKMPGGWAIFSGKGERMSGYYGSPNQALEIARPLTSSSNAEIVLFSKEQSFSAMRAERRLRYGKKKENHAKMA